MNVLSLFDGISCGRVALERAGIKVDNYFAAEIDKYAIQISKKNYPDIIHLGDVYRIDYTKFPKIDLVIGGSPCTYWSIAKKGRETTSEGIGFDLFMQFVKAVSETDCKWFLYENNHSIHKDIKEAITEKLRVEHIMINSALVSAQNRKRCYWTNIPNVTQPEDKELFLKNILESGESWTDKSYCLTSHYNGAVLWNTLERHQRSMVAEKYLFKNLRGYDEKSVTVCASTYKGIGNDGTTTVPMRIGHLNKGGQGDRIYSVKGKSICLSANGGGRGAKTGLYKIDIPDGDYIIRKLTPLECERLQTLPDNYTAGVSDTQRYKAIGNGWTVDVIAHILSFIKNN